jgi:hypothetical protein
MRLPEFVSSCCWWGSPGSSYAEGAAGYDTAAASTVYTMYECVAS